MNVATTPSRSADRKLLTMDRQGVISHHHRSELPSLLSPGDLVVANDAATLPASLHGIHARSGVPIEVRLAGHLSRGFRDVRQFTAVVFGAGDYRTRTEHRAPPPCLRVGERLRLGSLQATVTSTHSHPRLIDLRFDHPVEEVWEGLARHGRPIQYAYVQQPIAIWNTWTAVAGLPVAFEAPSAGFILDWAMLTAFRSRSVAFAAITHAAGISSTGDDELDRLLPFDEAYVIPERTATLVERTKARGGRVIALGTTVVRALEAAADDRGHLICGEGMATGRIGATSMLRIVDAIVSGVHQPDTSHYELLRAFQNDDRLQQIVTAAAHRGYRIHEYGDYLYLPNGRTAIVKAEPTRRVA
jgi:S-adenosylmethionine:tRNA ribosyltransferase-isomerase